MHAGSVRMSKQGGRVPSYMFLKLFLIIFFLIIFLNLFFFLRSCTPCSCAGYCDQIAVLRTHTTPGKNHNIFKPELQIELCRAA